MPIYEYACGKCEDKFEVFRKITDETDPTCPVCGEVKVKKLVSASGFQLRGSGWYKDGYAKSPCQSEEKSSSSKPSVCQAGTCCDASK